jgi:UDP-glucose 4-epimerase
MNDFTNMPVLVAGGLGFIGSNVVRRLVTLGANVTVIDGLIPDQGGNLFNIGSVDDQVRVVNGDVRDSTLFGDLIKGKRLLFNLVGQVSHIDSMQDPMADLEFNVRSQIAMLEVCRRLNPEIKVIYTSTRQIYGKPEYLPVDERHPVHPTDVNGINKMAGEYLHILYYNVHAIRTCALRLTNTYGPGQLIKHNRQGFMGWFIRQIVLGEEINIYGDGEQTRDLIFVDDVVEGMLLAALDDKANGQTFNLGNETSISLKALVEMMIRLHGGGSYRLVPFPPEKKKIDIGNFRTDSSKITKELGWRPLVTLEQGLRDTIKYYQQNLSHYVG